MILLIENSFTARVLAKSIVMQNLKLKGIIIQTETPISKEPYKGNLIKIISRKVFSKTVYKKLSYLKKPSYYKEIYKIEKELKKQADVFLLKHLGRIENITWPSQIDRLTVPHINSENSYNFLIKAKPELLVVWGTSILKKNILEIPTLGVLNAHHAILPDYRGNFVEFWQVYNSDYDKAGITIHFANIGVDTGDIIFQKKLIKKIIPNPFLLRAMNTVEIINNYPHVIKSVLSGTAKRKKQGKSLIPTHRLSDITMEKKLELYTRLSLMSN